MLSWSVTLSIMLICCYAVTRKLQLQWGSRDEFSSFSSTHHQLYLPDAFLECFFLNAWAAAGWWQCTRYRCVSNMLKCPKFNFGLVQRKYCWQNTFLPSWEPVCKLCEWVIEWIIALCKDWKAFPQTFDNVRLYGWESCSCMHIVTLVCFVVFTIDSFQSHDVRLYLKPWLHVQWKTIAKMIHFTLNHD